MRLITLCLLLATCWGCTSSKYSCADVFNTKQEKIPLKYRIGKVSKPKYKPQMDTAMMYNESPMLASLKQEHATTKVLPTGSQLALMTLIQQADSVQAAIPNPLIADNALDRRQKKEIRKALKSTVKEIKGNGDDEHYKLAKTLGIISFSASILSILFFPLCIVGLVTGIISLNQYKKTINKEHRIFALLGVIFSSIWVLLLLLFIFLILLLFNSGWGY